MDSLSKNENYIIFYYKNILQHSTRESHSPEPDLNQVSQILRFGLAWDSWNSFSHAQELT